MPFDRPTLTALRSSTSADLSASLKGADPLLRFSNLNVTVRVQAGLVHGCYGYLDWIADQATPFTATDEAYLSGWAGLRGLTRKPVARASGQVAFSGSAGTVIPAGTRLVRGDGRAYATTSAATIIMGAVIAPVTAVDAGADGNADAGATLTLQAPLAGLSSTCTATTEFAGGVDAEELPALRARMLARYAAPPQGGSRTDYPDWAKELPAVTRAWCAPQGFGPGTVVVYVMLDLANAGAGGFPYGSDGVAAFELRGAPSTGDQLAVANHLFPLQPAEALVYVCAPVADPQIFTIAGMPPAAQALVAPAIIRLLNREATPGGVFLSGGSVAGRLPISRIWTEVAAATGVYSFQITAPTTDIVSQPGRIATLGAVGFV